MADLTPFDMEAITRRLNEVNRIVSGLPLGQFIQHCNAALSPTAFPHDTLWLLVTRDGLDKAKGIAELILQLNHKE